MKILPEGVCAAAITPRRLGVQDINLGAMWELIDFLCERGVHGLALLGATGEFPHFSNSERMRMMGLAPKRSRVPVILNVSHSNLDGAVELAEAAAASGAAGLLLMPPYFFRYTRDDMRTFYHRFREEADVSTPVLLYNLPQFGNGIPVDLAVELIRDGVAQGIKDSSGDPEYLGALAAARREQPFTLMAGNDALYSRASREGISGVISGSACALPELMVALHKALASDNHDVAGRLEARLAEFLGWVDRFPTPVGIREATCLRGISLGPNATPASEAGKGLLEEYRAWFRPWLKDVLAECKLA